MNTNQQVQNEPQLAGQTPSGDSVGTSPLDSTMNPMNQVAPVPPKEPMIGPGLLWTLIIVVVVAVGYFGWNYYSQSKTPTETPAVKTTTPATTSATTPATTKTADPTATWTTYTNTKYGYSLKYPTGWYVYAYKTGEEAVTNDLSISLKDAQAQSHYIKVSPGSNTGMEAIITAAATKPDYKKTAITLEGQEATQYTWTVVLYEKNAAGIKLIKVDKGNYTYYLYGMVTDYNKTAEVDQGNFDQILSTFKFTN